MHLANESLSIIQAKPLIPIIVAVWYGNALVSRFSVSVQSDGAGTVSGLRVVPTKFQKHAQKNKLPIEEATSDGVICQCLWKSVLDFTKSINESKNRKYT